MELPLAMLTDGQLHAMLVVQAVSLTDSAPGRGARYRGGAEAMGSPKPSG